MHSNYPERKLNSPLCLQLINHSHNVKGVNVGFKITAVINKSMFLSKLTKKALNELAVSPNC